MKEYTDDACNLDMKPGLHQERLLKYPANYMHAPRSAFPNPAPKDVENFANDLAMKMTFGR
jgi:hypothetical protein